VEKQLRVLQSRLSTFAIENDGAASHLSVERRAPVKAKGENMRIIENAAATIVALAAQMLVVATVMI
jgi:hypothetical protein